MTTWHRHSCLCCTLACIPFLLSACLFGLSVSGEDLIPRFSDGKLQVSAPKLHFISGNQLARLRNGASVPFDFQLTLFAGSKGSALTRALERFVVSYDLWEEKFSVIRQRDRRISSVRLSATQAEAWCLENLAIPSSGVPFDKNLWVRLEVRAGDNRDPAIAKPGGINLATLVDIFSRPARGVQDHWPPLETGPFRLGDLKR
ncbi:MAG: hypothetical protein ACR2NN_04375 [Bryobacteraceae bacterium]